MLAEFKLHSLIIQVPTLRNMDIFVRKVPTSFTAALSTVVSVMFDEAAECAVIAVTSAQTSGHTAVSTLSTCLNLVASTTTRLVDGAVDSTLLVTAKSSPSPMKCPLALKDIVGSGTSSRGIGPPLTV